MTTEETMTAAEILEDLVLLGVGVEGVKVLSDDEDVTYFPIIMATKPGSGDVGRWLDALPKHKTYRIPGVINAKLAGMLTRRGWKQIQEFAPEFGEFMGVYEREAEITDGK